MKGTNGIEWTDEEIEEIINLWNKGHSASEIANVLKTPRSRSAVMGKIHRLYGIKHRGLVRKEGRKREKSEKLWTDNELLDLCAIIDTFGTENSWTIHEAAKYFKTGYKTTEKKINEFQRDCKRAEKP